MEDLVALQTRHAQLTRNVEILTKCREKKDLTSAECDALIAKYELFLLEADNLLSHEQKQRNIVKALRSNVSTLIGALEELLGVEKQLFEAVRRVEAEGGSVQSLPVSSPPSSSSSAASSTAAGAVSAQKTAGNAPPTQGGLSSKLSRPLRLGFSLSSPTHSNSGSRLSASRESSSHRNTHTHTPAAPVTHTVTSQSVREALSQHLLTALSLRQTHFLANMTGRSHADRTHTIHAHIATTTRLFDTFAEYLPSPEDGHGFKKTVNLRALYLEGLEFADLDLKYVDFGNNSIRDCLFLRCQMTLSQFSFVTHFEGVLFEESFRKTFFEFKVKQARDALKEIESMIDECKHSLDCLLNFFLFACAKPFEVRVACASLSLDDLRRTAFSLLNDEDINRIGIDGGGCDDGSESVNVSVNADLTEAMEREKEKTMQRRSSLRKSIAQNPQELPANAALNEDSQNNNNNNSNNDEGEGEKDTRTERSSSAEVDEDIDSERDSESGTQRWSYLWVNEHRPYIFSLGKEALYLALHRMLSARHYVLPEEVLSLSIDRKTYNFEEEISSSKLFLQEIERSLHWLRALRRESDGWEELSGEKEREGDPLTPRDSFAKNARRESLSHSHHHSTHSHGHHRGESFASFSQHREKDRESYGGGGISHGESEKEREREREREKEKENAVLDALLADIRRLITLQASVLAERSQRRAENNIFRRSVYLAMLNAEPDVALRQGPTERLSEVMKLSRVTDFATHLSPAQRALTTSNSKSKSNSNSNSNNNKNSRRSSSVDTPTPSQQRQSVSRGQSPLTTLTQRASSPAVPAEAENEEALVEIASPYNTPYLVDLTYTDLSRVDFSQIDFTHVFSLVTPEQERDFLTPLNRIQRYSLLFEYARSGDALSLTRLVTECALDVNVCDARGTSALMHACIARQPSTARVLVLTHHASVDIVSPTGWDVMSTLCAVRDPITGKIDAISREIAEFLMKEVRAVVSVHNAARLGLVSLLKKFSLKELQSLCPATEYSVAHIAARDNNVEILKFLNDRKFDFEHAHQGEIAVLPQAKGGKPVNGKGNGVNGSAQGSAGNGNSSRSGQSYRGGASAVENDRETERERAEMLERARDRERPSALWVACEHGRTDAALALVQYCPKLRDVSFRGLSPVKIALRLGHTTLARELQRCGCAVDAEVAVALRDTVWVSHYLHSLADPIALHVHTLVHTQASAVSGAQSVPLSSPPPTLSRFSSLRFLSPHKPATTPSSSSSAPTTGALNTPTPLPTTGRPSLSDNFTLDTIPCSIKSKEGVEGVQTLLLHACKSHWEELVCALLRAHGDVLSLSHRYDREHAQRVVDLVCAQGHLSLMKSLLLYSEESVREALSEEGEKAKEESGTPNDQTVAEKNNSNNSTQTSSHATINPRLRFSLNASHAQCPALVFTAISRRRWAILQRLLDQPGLDLSVRHNGRTPLHSLLLAPASSSLSPSMQPHGTERDAAERERERESVRVSERERESGTEEEEEDPLVARDPLALPLSLRCALVQKMLRRGASVLVRDDSGQTALHYAARLGDEVAAVILRAFVALPNRDGLKALDIASRAGLEMATLKDIMEA